MGCELSKICCCCCCCKRCRSTRHEDKYTTENRTSDHSQRKDTKGSKAKDGKVKSESIKEISDIDRFGITNEAYINEQQREREHPSDDTSTTKWSYINEAFNEEKDTLTLHSLPSLHRHASKRGKLFASVDVFLGADARALQAPRNLKNSMPELVSYLTQPFPFSKLLRLRAIWRWVTKYITYDVKSYISKNYPCQEAESVLARGNAVCAGYSNLLEAMCRLADVEVRCVSGWSKGFGYEVGESFEEMNTTHAWNVVSLDNAWWLLEPTWAAGRIDKVTKNFVKEYTEHYFMVDPKLFILDHLPEDANWQLLEQPITIKEFEKRCVFKQELFQCGVEAVSTEDAVIECTDGRVHLKFKLKEGTELDHTAKLIDSNGKEKSRELIFMYRKESILHLHVVVPEEGKYLLDIFARPTSSEEFQSNQVYDRGSSTIPLICSYAINSMHKMDRVICYPKQYNLWSRGFLLHSPIEGPLIVDQTYNFLMTIPQGVEEMAIYFNDELTALTMVNDSRVWTRDVHIFPGTERLRFSVRYVSAKSNTYSSLLEFTTKAQANCTSPTHLIRNEDTNSKDIRNFALKGMKELNHTSFCILSTDGKVHLQFRTAKSLDFSCHGVLLNPRGGKEKSDKIMVYTRGNLLNVHVLVPDVGQYKLKLYGSDEDNNNNHVNNNRPLLCTYIIDCRHKMDPVLTFPMQYGKWGRTFQLHSPLEGPLVVGESYPFNIMLGDDVDKIAIFFDERLTAVTTLGDDWTWQRDVRIIPGTKCVRIAAAFSEDDDGYYSYLLEYTTTQTTRKSISNEANTTTTFSDATRFPLKHMVALNHNGFYIDCTDGKIHLQFSVSEEEKTLDYTANLRNSLGEQERDDQVFTYIHESVIHVHALVPQEGNYTLDIFAGYSSTLSTVCSYSVNCTHKTTHPLCYPKKFSLWDDGFFLHQPMEGPLVAGQICKFRISFGSDVDEIVVCGGGRVIQTTEEKVMEEAREKRIWESDFEVPAGLERVQIGAKYYNSKNGSYSHILEYVVRNGTA